MRRDRKLLPVRSRCAWLAVLLVGQAWAGAPRIACKAPEYDFGTRANTQAVEHVFMLLNEGSAPLQIGQIRSCCGASATVSDTIVPPGTGTALRVVFSLAGRSGKQDKSLYVASNDPRQPYLQLRLVGTADEAITTLPRSVAFGVIDPNAATQAEVAILCASNIALKVTNMVTSADFSASFAASGAVWKVNVRTAASLPLGVTRGTLTILTDHKDYPKVEVPLTVIVAEDLVVIPEEIVVIEPSQQPVPVTRCVSLRSRAGRVFRILDITAPDAGIKAELAPLASGGYRITLSNIIPFEDLNGKDLVVTTDHPLAKRIAVPFVVRHQSELATHTAVLE